MRLKYWAKDKDYFITNYRPVFKLLLKQITRLLLLRLAIGLKCLGHEIFKYLVRKSFQNDEEWRLFYCDSRLVADLIKICISYQFFDLGKSNPVAPCKRDFFPFFKQVRGRVKPLLCGLLGTELNGLESWESGQSKIWIAMSQEEKKITLAFAHAVIQHTHKSLLENCLQLSKSIFLKSVLLKLTKKLFTSV